MINKKNQKGEALKKLRAPIHVTFTMPSAELRHKVSRKNHSGKISYIGGRKWIYAKLSGSIVLGLEKIDLQKMRSLW